MKIQPHRHDCCKSARGKEFKDREIKDKEFQGKEFNSLKEVEETINFNFKNIRNLRLKNKKII